MLALLAIPAENRRLIRIWANAVSIATFLLSLCFIAKFDLNAGGYQFVERAQWIPSIGAQYLLGMDGISLLMVLLTTLISAIAALARGDLSGADEAVLLDDPSARDGRARRISFAGSVPVLSVLGCRADSDVFLDRDIRKRAARLRGH